MRAIEITELLGDGIGLELHQAVATVADVLPIELRFVPVDLSLKNRRAKGRAIYDQAIASMRTTRLAFGMLLDHIDRRDLGRSLRRAIFGLIEKGRQTADLGGTLGCRDYTQVVVDRMNDELRGQSAATTASEPQTASGKSATG